MGKKKLYLCWLEGHAQAAGLWVCRLNALIPEALEHGYMFDCEVRSYKNKNRRLTVSLYLLVRVRERSSAFTHNSMIKIIQGDEI